MFDHVLFFICGLALGWYGQGEFHLHVNVANLEAAAEADVEEIEKKL